MVEHFPQMSIEPLNLIQVIGYIGPDHAAVWKKIRQTDFGGIETMTRPNTFKVGAVRFTCTKPKTEWLPLIAITKKVLEVP